MSKRTKSIYLVVQGRQPGVYTQWEGSQGAKAQVSGVHGAIYKGFYTSEEACNWLKSQSHQSLPPALMQWLVEQESVGTDNALDSLVKNHLHNRGTVIFTDGSTLGNPGPGGYAAVILTSQTRRELSGGFRLTTNNRMELMACIAALESLQPRAQVLLITDSAYVYRPTVEGWLMRWANTNWKRRDGKTIENVDLWQRLFRLCQTFRVEFHWIKGHNATVENERCDRLALNAAHHPGLPEDPGYQMFPLSSKK
jgi:ribonuclease HI